MSSSKSIEVAAPLRVSRGAERQLRALGGRAGLSTDAGARDIAQAMWDLRVAHRLVRRRHGRLRRLLEGHAR